MTAAQDTEGADWAEGDAARMRSEASHEALLVATIGACVDRAQVDLGRADMLAAVGALNAELAAKARARALRWLALAEEGQYKLAALRESLSEVA